MAFVPEPGFPDLTPLIATLNNSQISVKNPALYQTIKGLIDRVQQIKDLAKENIESINQQITDFSNTVNNLTIGEVNIIQSPVMPVFDGVDGEDGIPGPPGFIGRDGTIGRDGPPGIDGLDGLDGEQGFPGPPGIDGATGAPGVTTIVELPGMPGMDGETGETGYDGIPGAIGPTGSAGATGSAGIGTPGPPGLDAEDPELPYMIPGPQGIQGVAGGGGGSATNIEVDLGSTAAWRGTFTITDAAISATSKVLAWQAPGPYTNKGTLPDEAEMQPVSVIAVNPAVGSALVYWQTPPMITINPRPRMGRYMSGVNNVITQPKDPAAVGFHTMRRIGKVRGNVKFSYVAFT